MDKIMEYGKVFSAVVLNILLLTYSMEQSHDLESNRFSAGQEISRN
jgi:hypothetical protein